MNTRHTWDKLDLHRYRCRRCGLLKVHVPVDVGRRTPDWELQFTATDGTVTTGRTPPCPGETPAPASERPVQRARGLGQWNAYVEAGATIAERRARLAEVPEAWRESVRAHVTLVFQLKDAARLRAQDQARKASALGLAP